MVILLLQKKFTYKNLTKNMSYEIMKPPYIMDKILYHIQGSKRNS